MTTKSTVHTWQARLAWSAVYRVSGLLIFGYIGWLWFLSSGGSARRAVSLIAVLALAALVGITWYLAAARAERRWRAALDRYAEKEAAKRDSPAKGDRR
jgi:hypothetical protein